MLKIKSQIASVLEAKMKAINPDSPAAQEIANMLEYPPDASMGDLSLPCFKLSKLLRRSPVQIAETLAEGFEFPA
ncbi:MAG: hypothetical protein II297_04915 [Clostridia bacterium]|nr:hypothetical protein [Clostridia bacterium]